jgi:RNA polymerase sigma-70 factor (ECF subfamily)
MDGEISSAPGLPDERTFNRAAQEHRGDLLGYCYRMTGSLAEAEDAVQETFLRAWKGRDGFQGRSSVATWLRSIATRACLDALEARPARSLPLALGEPADPGAAPAPPIEASAWIDPAPDAWLSVPPTPEARYSWRESVALAFLVALQRLPPRQRAVLLMRDVLGMSAAEVAEALEASVASVNSALQRARETLDLARAPGTINVEPIAPPSAETGKLLRRYVAAWEQADASMLLDLLREDSVLSMPPYTFWFRGAAAIVGSIGGMVLPPAARGRYRFVETAANGLPAVACYARESQSEKAGFEPMALHVLRPEGDRLAEITAFLNPGLFRAFSLPREL